MINENVNKNEKTCLIGGNGVKDKIHQHSWALVLESYIVSHALYFVLSAMNDVAVVCMADLACIGKFFQLQNDIASKHRTIRYHSFDMRVSVMHFFPRSVRISLLYIHICTYINFSFIQNAIHVY